MISREVAKDLRTDLQEVLDTINREGAVRAGGTVWKLSLGNGTIGGVVTFKLDCAPVVNGQATSKAAEDFKKYADMFGLEPEDLGAKFESRGETYTITGLSPHSRKFPILATRDSDGKTFKHQQDHVVLQLHPTMEDVKRIAGSYRSK